MLALVIVTIAVALVFDFYNGMNDAANSVATVVSTRVLTPRQAVLWAAFWNFVAAFLFGTAVAKSIHGGVLKLDSISQMLVLSTLLGAILWTHACTKMGLPISVSHALIGGLIGAGLMKSGFDFGVLMIAGVAKIGVFIFLAPIIGMASGAMLMILVYWLFRHRRPAKVDRVFRVGQLFSAAAFSLGHGGNDAQKTMGMITMALVAGGFLASPLDPATGKLLAPNVPLWVVLAAHAAIAVGTMLGGWRVIRTMGTRLTKLKPVQGFCAETAGALVLFGVTAAGIPVSTTHSVTGAIMGVGSARRLRAVRWGVATKILWAWIITIPTSAIVSGLTYWLLDVVGLVAWADGLG
ncbi:MAG: inorganic phosphate transporter [Planctomycetaceae bacterium]